MTMPVAKGKKLFRCALSIRLCDQLAEEADRQRVDVGTLVEGYLVEALRRQRGEVGMIERRLDHLADRQDAILALFEQLVQGLGAGTPPPPPGGEAAPPIATYDQLYARAIDQGISDMAGYDMRAFLVAQDLDQLWETYGERTPIWGNCSVKLFHAPANDLTAKRISEHFLGEQTVENPVAQQSPVIGHRRSVSLATHRAPAAQHR